MDQDVARGRTSRRWVDSTRGIVPRVAPTPGPPRPMKAWRGEEGDAERHGTQPRVPDPATLADLQQHGIDLDPTAHEHGSDEPEHAHPHRHADPGEPPLIGIVGAGAVGTALGAALHRAGWPVVAVGLP